MPLAEERVLRDMKDILLNKTYMRTYYRYKGQVLNFRPKEKTETKNYSYSHAFIHPYHRNGLHSSPMMFKNRSFAPISHRLRKSRILKK